MYLPGQTKFRKIKKKQTEQLFDKGQCYCDVMPTAAVCTKEVVHDKGKFGSTCGRDCHKCDEAGASVFVTAKNTS